MGTDLDDDRPDDLTAFLDSILAGFGPIITVKQAADRLQMSNDFIRAAIADGSLSSIRLGRSVRIAALDFGVFVARRWGNAEGAERVEAGRRLDGIVRSAREPGAGRVEKIVKSLQG